MVLRFEIKTSYIDFRSMDDLKGRLILKSNASSAWLRASCIVAVRGLEHRGIDPHLPLHSCSEIEISAVGSSLPFV